ncbi:MAG: hypothetical protein WBD99_06400 [Thermodesulfobacteriota bacterium]
MIESKIKNQLFAICINNSGYPASLELYKVYRVLSDKVAEAEGDMRVIDESGEDYIYPSERFVLIDLPQKVIEKMQSGFLAEKKR